MKSNYNDKRRAAPNRRLAQWRVTWLIKHSTSHQLLWCIDSFVLRNPPLRQAAKRCIQYIFRTGEFNNLMQQMINFIFVELWKNYAGD